MSDHQPIVCIINPDNIVIDVNQAWDYFALQNNCPESTRIGVLEKSILDAVSGKVTKQYWRDLLARAWLSTQPLKIDYRCDSPDTKRWMQMELCRLEDGNMRISHIQLASEKRTPAIHFKLASQRSSSTHIRCSICNRLKENDHWHEAETLIKTGNNAGSVYLPVIYGVCTDCGTKEI